jgi:hypothetical protein
LLAAGDSPAGGPVTSSLEAIRIQDGQTIWSRELPASAVKGGVAIDSQARIVVALENGQVICLQ